jgi:hypothetical protein
MLGQRLDGSVKPHPLTHHEILGLIAPFTRRSRHADLAASNRLERRIVFKPVERPLGSPAGGSPAGRSPTAASIATASAAAASPARATLRDTLTLENAASGSYRLTRVLAAAGGVTASLEAAGANPQGLLACIEAVGPERQFRQGPGYSLVLCFSIEPWSPDSHSDATHLRLTRGVVELGDLTATMTVPSVNGIPATVELAAAHPRMRLPPDLLAVLGRDWAPLTTIANGWKGLVKLRGRGAQYGRDAEDKLELMAVHLAQTLAEPPARFHERLVAARWAVAFRRILPVLVCAALIAAAAAVPHLHLAETSVIRMLIFNSPPLLLMLAFCMRDLPRFEIPSLPRALRGSSWREPPPSRHTS